MIISHRDLEPKNVMWSENDPLIIDWESAGYINPMVDLLETAIYWSTNERRQIDKQKFLAFVNAYKRINGELHSDWEKVLAMGFISKLGWLEYSMKRSLWMECTDEEEQQLGTKHVPLTIHEILNYSKAIPKLIDWLQNER